jgi:hypothetical protein
MTPKTKALILMVSLALPNLIFILYFVFTAPPNSARPFPNWFPMAAGTYMLVAMFLGTLISRRINRSNTAAPQSRQTLANISLAKGNSMALVTAWSLFFVYGAYETLIGRIPIQRAIPAGALLLGFIALFSWSIGAMPKVER